MSVIQDLIEIRPMTEEDYDGVRALWMTIQGFGIRTVDDSREGITRFLRRNPGISCVAVLEGRVIGAILCGHDGRRGCFYHVCVAEKFRMHGIGEQMAVFCRDALTEEGISKVNLIAFKNNPLGNAFWKKLGWTERADLNYFDLTLNENNVTNFVK